ncbi:MAG: hypothetical protein IEMM0002_0614 [bacterium]|nr:MAG: hypothetical protein IEMM0002_0614 [bacterium]
MRKLVSVFCSIAFLAFVWGVMGASQAFDDATHASKDHKSSASPLFDLIYEAEENNDDANRFAKKIFESIAFYNKSNNKQYSQQLIIENNSNALLLSSVRIIV